MSKEKVIRVKLIGDMQISYGGKTIGYSDIRSEKLIKFLAYLLYNHDKKISSRELMDVCWEKDDIKNPRGALKNLMYRLRKTLRQYWGGEDFWKTYLDGYGWNPKYRIEVDTDNLKKIFVEDRINEVTNEALEDWLNCYTGDFLAGHGDLNWIVYIRTYYHTRYFLLLDKLCKRLKQGDDYEKIETLAIKSLALDSTEEIAHYWFLYANIMQKKYTIAEKSFNEMLKHIYNGDRLQLPPSLEKMGIIIDNKKYDDIGDIKTMIQKLISENREGPLGCDSDILKRIWDLEYRKSKREKTVLTLISLEVKSQSGIEELALAKIKKGVRNLRLAIRKNLRTSDVYSELTNNKFILLLAKCDIEGGRKFLERMNKDIDKKLFANNKIILKQQIIDTSSI